MYLYHGTDPANTDEILESGLEPRVATNKSNWHQRGYESIGDHVYLTDKYAPCFGLAATEGKEIALVEINLESCDNLALYPDEDFVAQALKQDIGEEIAFPEVDGVEPDKSLQALTEQVRKNIDEYQHWWEKSLQLLGNVSYRGRIAPSAIRRVSIVDLPSEVLLDIDPTISIQNALFVGRKYEMYTQLLMGEDVTDEEYLAARMGISGADGPADQVLMEHGLLESLDEKIEQLGGEALKQDYITIRQNPSYNGSGSSTKG